MRLFGIDTAFRDFLKSIYAGDDESSSMKPAIQKRMRWFFYFLENLIKKNKLKGR